MEIIIEWISSILFIIAGILSSTRYIIKLKVKIGSGIFCLIANLLWTLYCIMNSAWMYMWVGILYIILGIIGIVNFVRIYKKAKKGKEYKII